MAIEQNSVNQETPVLNGELIIGRDGDNPVNATLTAGFGISITNGAGSITIEADGQKQVEVITAATTVAEDTNYIANGATALDITLPVTMAVGDIFRITDINSGFKILQAADQYVNFGNKTTTVGISGNIETRQANSSITLMCVEENLGFNVLSAVGNFNLDVV